MVSSGGDQGGAPGCVLIVHAGALIILHSLVDEGKLTVLVEDTVALGTI